MTLLLEAGRAGALTLGCVVREVEVGVSAVFSAGHAFDRVPLGSSIVRDGLLDRSQPVIVAVANDLAFQLFKAPCDGGKADSVEEAFIVPEDQLADVLLLRGQRGGSHGGKTQNIS